MNVTLYIMVSFKSLFPIVVMWLSKVCTVSGMALCFHSECWTRTLISCWGVAKGGQRMSPPLTQVTFTSLILVGIVTSKDPVVVNANQVIAWQNYYQLCLFWFNFYFVRRECFSNLIKCFNNFFSWLLAIKHCVRLE